MVGYAVLQSVGGDVAGWYLPEEHAMLMLRDLIISELPPSRDHDCWLATRRDGGGSFLIKKPRRSDPTHREYHFVALNQRKPNI